MLRLEKVTARAGSFNLKPLDLEIARGECHALLGPSGAGKSTVLELIVGFRQLTSGRMFMHEEDLTLVPVEKRSIGYLPQDLALFPHLTVEENILYGIRSRRQPDTGDLAMIAALTASLGLTELRQRLPGNLSGGERQRVALARALAPAPELLILDEPFSALNESLRRELWEIVQGLQRKYGVAMLMVTHDLEEAFFFGEQVHILIDGRLHQSGARNTIFHRPATLATARFLGIPNLFSARVSRQASHGIMLDCQSLGIQLTMNSGGLAGEEMHNGSTVIIGIRPEFIELNFNGGNQFPENPKLQGELVEITEKMLGSEISFRIRGTDALVKLRVGRREAAMLKRDPLEISLPLSHLFYIPTSEQI